MSVKGDVKGGAMKRHVAAILVAAAFTAAGATPALADAGAPGATFPEQPGTPSGCAAVTTNPGTGPGGEAVVNFSDTADGILGGLLVDACFGG
jgi:hypothetical protein